jgi:hypothetical protein
MVPIETAGTEYLMKMPFAFLNRVSVQGDGKCNWGRITDYIIIEK